MSYDNPQKEHPWEWIPPEAPELPPLCPFCGLEYSAVTIGPVFTHFRPSRQAGTYGSTTCGIYDPREAPEPEAHGSLKGLK